MVSIFFQCVDWTLFSLTHGGVILGNSDSVGEGDVTVLHAHPLLKGGKGGKHSLHVYITCRGVGRNFVGGGGVIQGEGVALESPHPPLPPELLKICTMYCLHHQKFPV